MRTLFKFFLWQCATYEFFQCIDFEFLHVYNSKAIKVSYIISIHMLGFEWEPVVLYLLRFITDVLFIIKIYYLFVVTLLKGTYFFILENAFIFVAYWSTEMKELNKRIEQPGVFTKHFTVWHVDFKKSLKTKKHVKRFVFFPDCRNFFRQTNLSLEKYLKYFFCVERSCRCIKF